MAENEGSIVLYIDDDAANRHLMARLFTRKLPDHQLTLAATGEEGLQQAESDDIAVVLLDLTLPDMSGEEVLQTLKARHELPVVILSGHDDPATRRRLTEEGADAYITKPFDANELFRVIGSLLGES